MSSQADETPGETDPRWGMVTLARLQPGSKVQDRVRDRRMTKSHHKIQDKVQDRVQDKARRIRADCL